ncbi:isoleucyl-tRNA synthetase [Fibrisoma limi BUZ 3]|uniref:Isoleucine--tRNA ligase n=1 Tax=Fibrisoma limi BUZ 3 TaxID=1185876 RepID=I2GN25_9BACT|nr:isoleucine--tRNA ligase [Fibrisoma limi]CCH55303.1 isoleucyl-tRNA synthetase [Fibrisoma limi BUZ 3]
MKYKQYESLDYAQIAAEVLSYWNQNQVFEQSVAIREGQPSFTFYEGPPSANGTPGIHHVMARTIKDIFCRYKTLRGFQVKRKGGWDTHGLPIELQVEKELGITKEDIGKTISVEEYNQKCRETVMRFTDQWNEMTQKMGYWVDLDNPYVTYENEYIETLWYLLKQLYEKGLLYKGYTIQPYSPKAGTGLSSHELNMPGTYKDVKDTTIVAQFRVKPTGKSGFLFFDSGDADVYILAWTTTPWTLPANSALTVGKDIDYVLVKTFNQYTHESINVVLAKALVGRWFNEKGRQDDPSSPVFDTYLPNDKVIPWAIVSEFKGEHLQGVEYEQLMPYVQPEGNAFRVILGDFVTTEDGTGVVHTSPTFGADDFRVAQANGIPAIMVKDETGKDVPIVDKQGRFVQEITDFAGRYVKEQYYSDEEQADPDFKPTDVLIAIKLKEENKAFRVEKYEHPYPHCWRTDRPVLYYPLDSWFIRTTAVKDRMVELNKTINWQPESTGTGRFGNWLENLVDWNLSRSRYWGTPLPIWRAEAGEEVCIGSVAELVSMSERANERMSEWVAQGKTDFQAYIDKNKAFLAAYTDGTYDLHRPYSDELYFVSDKGNLMQREPDLIDVWFDSGAMPYAQWHYPFANQDTFEQAFPADFISEGVDQTRGWFFTLHAIAVMLFDSVAFKNVVSTGLVLDKNGNKMSKRLGNAIDPFETLANFGPDATRWYMITNAEPWDNLRFNLDGVGEVQRKFFGTLFNTYNFFALYANLDNYTINEFDRVPRERLTELDRWILSKLNTLIKDVTEQYEAYNPTKAGRLIQDFVSDQLSNWYVRLSRRRFWTGAPKTGASDAGELTEDKRAAYETLQHCLLTVGQLMSPIAPFFADWLYHSLTDGIREVARNQNTAVADHPLRHDSVHLTDWHPYEADWVDTDLETSMQLAQDISSLVHSLRKGHKLKVRQPLSRVLIPVLNEQTRRQIEHVAPIIMSEVNVKAVEFVDDASGILKKKVKPNFKALGPKFGKQMKDVAAAITAMTDEQLKELEQVGSLQLSVGSIALSDVEVLTEDIPGWLVASEGGLTVALDVTVTDELRREGIARDFVNRIQNLRKDRDFDVTDKIRIELERNDEALAEAIEANKSYIQQEVQAVSLDLVGGLNGEAVEIEMDEFLLRVKVAVAS